MVARFGVGRASPFELPWRNRSVGVPFGQRNGALRLMTKGARYRFRIGSYSPCTAFAERSAAPVVTPQIARSLKTLVPQMARLASSMFVLVPQMARVPQIARRS